MEIPQLTPAERRVWRAFPSGAHVDFRTSPDDDPASGGSWGPERSLRGDVLRALLLADHRADGEVAALRITGARITGTWAPRYAAATCAIRLMDCFFDAAPQLYGAEVRQLNLSGSVLPGLTAATLRVDGVLRLTGCRISGPVRLGGARVSGAIFLDGAVLTRPVPPEGGSGGPDGGAAGQDEPLLALNQVTCGDDLWAPGLKASGEVRLDGAVVAGSVRLDDAELAEPSGTALSAETLQVGADVHAMRIRVRGRVNLRGARIPGQLNLAHAHLANPGAVALRASSCVIGELWLRAAAPVEGLVNLRRSQLDLLHIAPDVWPERVNLDGLSYGALAPHEPAARRLPVLERDLDGYVPYAYEQLAAAYRKVGDDAGARTVQLAKQRRQRAGLAWYAALWGRVQDVTVGYGFRPMRAAAWLASLLLVGSVVYAVHRPPALKPAEAPHFNPVFYTLDLLLPVVDFGQEQAYAPAGWYQGLSYLLIITGWILATTIAAGVTRSISRPS